MTPIDRCTTYYWSVIVNIVLSYIYHFRVIWRWIISWPWNLDSGSLKVIEMAPFDRSRKSSYSFSILTMAMSFFWIKWIEAICWSKNADYAVARCLFVRLSHADILSKRLNISWNFLHHRIAVFHTKRYNSPTGMGRWMKGVMKNRDLRPLSRLISETIQDISTVTMEYE